MKFRPVQALLAASSVALVAGCATGMAAATATSHGGPATDWASMEQQATPNPSPTPTAISVAPGTVLTAEQVPLLAPGTAAYPMIDGSKVAVVKGQPVPPSVVADIQAKAFAKWPRRVRTARHDDINGITQLREYDTFFRTIGHDMGGFMPIAVAPACAIVAPDSTLLNERWVASYDSPHNNAGTRAGAIAKAQQTADAIGDAFVFPLDFPC